MALPDYRYRNAFATLEPEAKKERSRHVASAFTMPNLLLSEPEVDRQIDNLKDVLNERASSADGKPTELSDLLSYATYDISGEVIFSKPYGYLEARKDIGGSIANIVLFSIYAAIMGHYLWLHNLTAGNPYITDMGLLPYGHMLSSTIAALKGRMKNPDSRFDMIEHWLAAHKNDPKGFTVRDMHAQTMVTAGAASDTTSIAIQSFVYQIIQQPRVLALLQAEIDQAQKQGRVLSSVVSYSDTQSLPYFQACLKEAIRLWGPIIMSLARQVPSEGIKVGNEFFKQGTILSVNPWVMHKSKEVWGDDAEEFKPERWLSDDPNLKRMCKKYYIPVSCCPSICSGFKS